MVEHEIHAFPTAVDPGYAFMEGGFEIVEVFI